MSRITVKKDGKTLLDLDVPTVLTYLWLANGKAPARPYVVFTQALDEIEKEVVEEIEDES